MLIIGNPSEIEKSLREYIANGDYSKAFIIASWKSCEKNELVQKIAQETTSEILTEKCSLTDVDNTIPETFHVWTLYNEPHNVPFVILLDIQHDGLLRMLLGMQDHPNVYLLRYDDESLYNYKVVLTNQKIDELINDAKAKLYKHVCDENVNIDKLVERLYAFLGFEYISKREVMAEWVSIRNDIEKICQIRNASVEQIQTINNIFSKYERIMDEEYF